jgi:anti-sigma factor RsiW
MDYEAQLKLQAFLDGELSESEASEVVNWMARDKEAVALHAEMRNTRQAMVGFEVGIELPESREFFWRKVQHQIEGLEPQPVAAAPTPFWVFLRRLLIPATAVAALAVAALLVGRLPEHVPGAEIALADSGAFTYHDYSAGATLVWLPYPAESEVANNDETGTVE